MVVCMGVHSTQYGPPYQYELLVGQNKTGGGKAHNLGKGVHEDFIVCCGDFPLVGDIRLDASTN